MQIGDSTVLTTLNRKPKSQEQKFFGSFFQKRTALVFSPSLARWLSVGIIRISPQALKPIYAVIGCTSLQIQL